MRRVAGLVAVVVMAGVAAAAARARQAPPVIAFDSAPAFPTLPDGVYLGEVAGVATGSQGHLFVYTRTGAETVTMGTSRAFSRGGARLFEFDRAGRFMREIGQGVYGMTFAQAVRVDAHDNIWIVDSGSNQVIEFDQNGRIRLVLGRKPEALPVPAPLVGEPGGRGRRGGGAAIPGDNFNRPTDVGWDKAGNIFVADGDSDWRLTKFDPQGKYLGSAGGERSGVDAGRRVAGRPGSLVVDNEDHIYVSDHTTSGIGVFDDGLKLIRTLDGLGTATALCITSGPHQYLYGANASDEDSLEGGGIDKLDLDGHVLGTFGRTGKRLKEFDMVNALDCRSEHELYVGELANWRVQKLTLRP